MSNSEATPMDEIKDLLDQSAILSGELADKYPEKQMHALTSDQLMRLIELVEEAQDKYTRHECAEQVSKLAPAQKMSSLIRKESAYRECMIDNAPRVSQQLTNSV